MRTEIGALGEFGLIEHLCKNIDFNPEHTVKGIGDDAAIVDSRDGLTLISTDLLVEGVHFDLAYTPLKHLGYKAVVVNLSDIYAMNGTPRHITVSLAISNRFSVEAIEEIYEGMQVACQAYGVDLVGGDTTSSLKGLVISITAVGTVQPDKYVLRNSAQVGDLICVTGDLGAAYAGLQLLEREKRIFIEHPDIQPDLENQQYIVGRILKPEARRDIIDQFRMAGLKPTAMMDLSDGLSSDLRHICQQSGVGALIEEALLPLHNETYDMMLKFNMDPTTAALHGGEDYELLFTIAPADVDKVRFMMDVKIIGEILPAGEGLRIQTKSGNFHSLVSQGWKHF